MRHRARVEFINGSYNYVPMVLRNEEFPLALNVALPIKIPSTASMGTSVKEDCFYSHQPRGS